jgi:hypothetical protein
MRNNESFPLPEREFEHLPARVLESAEAQRTVRSVEITAASYHGELLAGLDVGVVGQITRGLASEDVDIKDYFDDSTCSTIERGYSLFKKTFESLPKDADVFSDLAQVFNNGLKYNSLLNYKETANGFSYPRSFLRTPSPAEYLVLIDGLANEAEQARARLEKTSSEIIKGMRQYLSDRDYLSTGAFDRRIKNIEVTVVDPFSMYLDSPDRSINGFYRNTEDNIFISSGTSNLPGTFTHELIHQLSGKRRLQITHNGSHDLQMRALMEGMHLVQPTQVFPQRVGLAIKWPRQRFEWLNEAVTSRLEHEMSESSEDRYLTLVERVMRERLGGQVRSYPEEQAFMDNILNNGTEPIDFSLIAKAYFEDDNPKDPGRLTHWKEFMHAVINAHSSDFLVAVDDTIKTEGVKDAQETFFSYM